MEKLAIAVDMMGSDKGPGMALEAVSAFHKENPEVSLFLVGRKEELGDVSSLGELVEAPDVLPMTAGALDVIRAKGSSIYKASSLVREGKCSAVVSAGGTGAFLSSAALILGKAEGVHRPALAASLPNFRTGGHTILLDCGASNENSGEELLQFALMGALYQRIVYGVRKPKVALLSNGAEEGKGSPEGKEAYRLLKENPKEEYQFIGNVEGKDVLEGPMEVLVSDGFSGNVLMKGVEGAAKAMGHLLKKAFMTNISTKVGYLLAKKGMAGLKESLDPSSIGGAMLLGVKGVAVKAHGASDPKGFLSALSLASRMAEGGMAAELARLLS